MSKNMALETDAGNPTGGRFDAFAMISRGS
jgi:hypothetical protein